MLKALDDFGYPPDRIAVLKRKILQEKRGFENQTAFFRNIPAQAGYSTVKSPRPPKPKLGTKCRFCNREYDTVDSLVKHLKRREALAVAFQARIS